MHNRLRTLSLCLFLEYPDVGTQMRLMAVLGYVPPL